LEVKRLRRDWRWRAEARIFKNFGGDYFLAVKVRTPVRKRKIKCQRKEIYVTTTRRRAPLLPPLLSLLPLLLTPTKNHEDLVQMLKVIKIKRNSKECTKK